MKETLALVHINICGYFHTSRHSHKYSASISDDATCYGWILFLKTKNGVIPTLHEWLAYAKSQSERKHKALYFDDGAGIYFLEEREIHHNYSVVHHRQQNGAATRFNRTLKEWKRSIVITPQLRVSYWEFEMLHGWSILQLQADFLMKSTKASLVGKQTWEVFTPLVAWQYVFSQSWSETANSLQPESGSCSFG